jgi:hypothetical protein
MELIFWAFNLFFGMMGLNEPEEPEDGWTSNSEQLRKWEEEEYVPE